MHTGQGRNDGNQPDRWLQDCMPCTARSLQRGGASQPVTAAMAAQALAVAG